MASLCGTPIHYMLKPLILRRYATLLLREYETLLLSMKLYYSPIIVRTKKISTQYKFNQMLKQGELPPNTPKYPDRFYKDWKGWDEFLHPTERFLPYSEAKRVMHTLNLRSSTEWREFCRAGKRPDNIPALPHREGVISS